MLDGLQGFSCFLKPCLLKTTGLSWQVPELQRWHPRDCRSCCGCYPWVASVCRSQAAEGRSRCGVWNLAGLPSNSSVDKTLCSICIRKAWSYSQPLAPSASVARQQRTDQGRGQLIEGSWPGDRWNNLYTTSCRDVLSCWYWYCIRSSSSSSNINISNFSVLGGTIIFESSRLICRQHAYDNIHMSHDTDMMHL